MKKSERLMGAVFLLCGLAAVGFVLALTLYLVVSGLPAIREIGLTEFLLGRTWDSTGEPEPRFCSSAGRWGSSRRSFSPRLRRRGWPLWSVRR